jgi:hypothetical protein
MMYTGIEGPGLNVAGRVQDGRSYLLVGELGDDGGEDLMDGAAAWRPYVQLEVRPVHEGEVNGPGDVGGGEDHDVPVALYRVYRIVTCSHVMKWCQVLPHYLASVGHCLVTKYQYCSVTG